MKLIMLTQYFPPETGAPQNRLFAIARTLQASGVDVTVITAMPNYPEMRIQEKYRGKLHVQEKMEGIRVHRVWLFVSKGRGLFTRLFNYFSFVFTSLIAGLIKLRKSDILFVESPPLFLGITAMMLARAKGARLVFNVSDLWPESAVQLGLVTNRSMIKASHWLEMECYRRAALVTGQTKGIVADIRARCPGKDVLWLPNGVDPEAIANVPATGDALRKRNIPPDAMVFVYAGIIGHAQGLEVILAAARELLQEKVIFLFIGDGPEKERLMSIANEQDLLRKVMFLERMDRQEVLSIIKESDAVIVPLRRNDLFKGAIPSKIFEALALEKPVLLGVDGEARQLFIEEGRGGVFFEPEDHMDLAKKIRGYLADPGLLKEHGKNGSAYVRQNFDRNVISGRLLDALHKITGR